MSFLYKITHRCTFFQIGGFKLCCNGFVDRLLRCLGAQCCDSALREGEWCFYHGKTPERLAAGLVLLVQTAMFLRDSCVKRLLSACGHYFGGRYFSYGILNAALNYYLLAGR